MFDLIITSGKQYCSVFAVEDVNSGTAALYSLLNIPSRKFCLYMTALSISMKY